jgi:hypothetical protein
VAAGPSGGHSSTMSNRLFPAEGVRIVIIDADVVALDLHQDEYLCLPDLGAHLTPQGNGWSVASDALYAGLLETGLFSDQVARPRPSAPGRPDRSTLDLGLTHASLIDDLRLLGVVLKYGRLAKDLSVHHLSSLTTRPQWRSDQEALARRLTSVFARRLPLVPGQGECLYRAFLLRHLLAEAGADVTWVFGVRTWPFAAHCWLQHGDLLLDDDLDRVSLYTPIHWVGS